MSDFDPRSIKHIKVVATDSQDNELAIFEHDIKEFNYSSKFEGINGLSHKSDTVSYSILTGYFTWTLSGVIPEIYQKGLKQLKEYFANE